MSDFVRQNGTKIGFDRNSWCILSPIEQSIKRKIEAVSIPLKDWNISINYGIKTGCNEAFIIDGETKDALIAQDPKSAEIIRPILRGRDIKRYSYDFADKYIILASFGSHEYLEEKYPAIYNHLLTYKSKLEQRGQCRYMANGKPNPKGKYPGQHHWLELDNNPRQNYLDDFSKPKIVYSETNDSKNTKIAFDDKKYLTDKTCFVIIGETDEITKHVYSILKTKVFSLYMKNLAPSWEMRVYH